MNKAKTIFLALIFLGIFGVAGSAWAATYYVDAAKSDDSGIGISWDTAKKTLQAGINLLNVGDELRIKTGIYTGGMGRQCGAGQRGTAWTLGNYVNVRSDDGNGDYDRTGVIISGDSSESPWNSGTVAIEDCAFWKFEHLTITGSQANNNEVAFIAEGTTPAASNPNLHGIWLSDVTMNGNPTRYLFQIISYDEIIIENSSFNCSGCNVDGDGVMLDIPQDTGSQEDYFDDLIFRHNTITGLFRSEYGALTLRRGGNYQIYGNYFYNLQRPIHLVLRHAQGANYIYNNVFEGGGSNYVHGPNANSYMPILLRGMTACYADGRNSGYHGVYGAYIFNNTIDLSAMPNNNEAEFSMIGTWNDTQDAIVQNNLVITDGMRTLISQHDATVWGGGLYGNCIYSDTEEIYRAHNNIIRNNVATGPWTVLEEERGSQTDEPDLLPSQAGWTLSDNLNSQGIGFLSLAGNKPNPFYELISSREGTSLLPAILTDFNGNPRGASPDVGAFEYMEIFPPPDTTPPSAPSGLSVE